jgi:hypothetical protein
MGWGTSGNSWDFGWNSTGPRVEIGGGAVEQGLFNLSDDQWHHIAVSFAGTSSDLNETKLFVDGKIVDAPASSTSGTVNTASGSALRIGTFYNSASRMAGILDEVRISSVARGMPGLGIPMKIKKIRPLSSVMI